MSGAAPTRLTRSEASWPRALAVAMGTDLVVALPAALVPLLGGLAPDARWALAQLVDPLLSTPLALLILGTLLHAALRIVGDPPPLGATLRALLVASRVRLVLAPILVGILLAVRSTTDSATRYGLAHAWIVAQGVGWGLVCWAFARALARRCGVPKPIAALVGLAPVWVLLAWAVAGI